MKITRSDYRPITITLENPEEEDAFYIGLKDSIFAIEKYYSEMMDKYTFNRRILFLKKVLNEIQ